MFYYCRFCVFVRWSVYEVRYVFPIAFYIPVFCWEIKCLLCLSWLEVVSSVQGLYEKALEDSEKALSLDKENIRALFRKARSLNELGRHKEAYECNSRCLLSLPHVSFLFLWLTTFLLPNMLSMRLEDNGRSSLDVPGNVLMHRNSVSLTQRCLTSHGSSVQVSLYR